MEKWANKVEEELKKDYLLHILKLNPYYFKRGFVKLLDIIGLKKTIKKILGR